MTGDALNRFPTHPAIRLTLLFGARDHDRHGSLMVHLLQRARSEGLAGATAFEAHEGFGISRRVHRTRIVSDDAPVMVIIVDEPDRVRGFLSGAEDLLRDVMVTLTDVTVVEL
jgi:uncharacterized protein